MRTFMPRNKGTTKHKNVGNAPRPARRGVAWKVYQNLERHGNRATICAWRSHPVCIPRQSLRTRERDIYASLFHTSQ